MPKPKSRTSKNKLNKKAKVPKWAVVLGVLVLVGLGAFFVYRSFATNYQISIVYCEKNNYSYCANRPFDSYEVPKKAYIRFNSRCNMGQREFKLLGKSNYQWHCLWAGA